MNRKDIIKLSFLIVLSLIVAFPITSAISGQDSHIMRYTRSDGSTRHIYVNADAGKLEIQQDGQTVFIDHYTKVKIDGGAAWRYYKDSR